MNTKLEALGWKAPRAYGEGSFTRDKRNGRWIYREVVDGVRVSKSGKTKAICKQRMKEHILAKQRESLLGKSDDTGYLSIPLQDGIKQWLYEVKKHTIKKMSYFDTLDTVFRNQIMDSEFGRIRINDLNQRTVQLFLNELCMKYSESTANKAHAVLSQYSAYVSSLGHDAKWMKAVKKPKKMHAVDEKRHGNMVLNDEQIKILETELTKPFVNGVSGYRYGYMFMFLIYSFLRIGEARALKWQDIDLEKGTITVNKTLIEIRKRDSEGQAVGGMERVEVLPKSNSGNRKFILPPQALNCLKKHRELFSGSFVKSDDYVFCTKNGNPVGQSGLNSTLKKALENAGIDLRLSLHDLRHTGISYWLRNGENIKAISRIAGHSNVNITMSIYYNLTASDFEQVFQNKYESSC